MLHAKRQERLAEIPVCQNNGDAGFGQESVHAKSDGARVAKVAGQARKRQAHLPMPSTH